MHPAWQLGWPEKAQAGGLGWCAPHVLQPPHQNTLGDLAGEEGGQGFPLVVPTLEIELEAHSWPLQTPLLE